jgi:hypothetical protein
MVAALAEAIESKAFSASLGLPSVELASQGGDRTFLAVKVVGSAGSRVVSLIKAVNRVVGAFGCKPYHSDPIPHVSLAWRASPAATDGRVLNDDDDDDDDDSASGPVIATLQVSQLNVRCGDRVSVIRLKPA